MPEQLSKLDEIKSAIILLGNLEDQLRMDWTTGAEPNEEQTQALQETDHLLGEAIVAMDKARSAAPVAPGPLAEGWGKPAPWESNPPRLPDTL